MEIKLFEVQKKNKKGLERLLEFPEERINENTFNEVMKQYNISASIEEESRLSSHIVCESLDSYTQQSQRYVVISREGFILPEEIKGTEHEESFKNIVMECFELYEEMTEEAEGKARGRGAKDSNYKHKIPIEDGRYIIPLAAKTNVFVTMPGNKVVNFYRNLIQNPQKELQEIADSFIENISEEFGKKAGDLIKKYAKDNMVDMEVVQKAYEGVFNQIDKNEVLFDRFEKPTQRVALGAISSTNPNTPSKVYEKWEKDTKDLTNEPDKRAKKIAEKVLGYGHESIAEHDRSVYGTEQSLTSYHQFERHRLPENHREYFEQIPIDREAYIPPKIEKNEEMRDKYLGLVGKVKEYRRQLMNEGYGSAASYLLLNADGVKVMTSSNARIDKLMLEQRTCSNAQGEIRKRSTSILDLLRDGLSYIYNRAGPPCTKDRCPEGDLSCKKTKEMRDKWGYYGK
ncbi:MAG: FAD-dependent thymidylate synthase [Candidatus Woesearchaeota archaeon]